MKMQVILHNKHEPGRGDVALQLENPYGCYGENLKLLELIHAGSATGRDCAVDRIDSPCRALKHLEGTEVEALDGEQIMWELIAADQGKVTPFGVIYENSMHLEPCYTGRNFPPYLDTDCLMEIALMPPSSTPEGSPGPTLFLPMSEQRLERALERAGMRTADEVKMDTWRVELPSALERWMNVPYEGLENLNRLCHQLSLLDIADRRKLEAVAAFAEPDSATGLRYLAENLDQFDFVPNIKTAEDYGRFMIQQSGQFSFEPSLDDFYNYEKYGEERMTHEEGRFVEQGYVSYHGGMALDELMRDDPAEMGQQMGGLG